MSTSDRPNAPTQKSTSTTTTTTTEASTAQGAAQATYHVEHPPSVPGLFRRLFRRAQKLVTAFRDAIVGTTRRAWNALKRTTRTVTSTAAGRAVLSGLGMLYMGRLAADSFRVLAYGAPLTYMGTAIALVLLAVGAAWFLEFASTLWNALSVRPNSAATA